MAYAGLSPATFTNNLTNVQLIDDISGSFNGSTQTFALTSNSAPFHAVSARSLIVVLGGIVQKPQVDYTVDGSNITFTVAPVAGLTFAARNIYGLNYLNNVNDGVITPAKLSTGGPTWNSAGNLTVSGDLNVVGSFNSGTQGLFWQDNEPANFGNDNDLKIFHDGVDSYIRDFGTGNLNIYGDNEITIRNGQGSEYKARFITDGAVELYHNAVKKFETTSAGIFVSGTARVPNATAFTSSDSGGTERWLMYMSGGVSPSSGNKLIIGNPLNDDVILFTNNTERLRITPTGNVGIGTTNPQTTLQVWGNGRFGSTSAVGKVGLLQTNGNENAYIQLDGGDNSLNLFGYGGINLQANGTNPTPVRGTYGVSFNTWSSRTVYFDGYGGFGGEVIMRDAPNSAEVFHAYMGDGTGGTSRKVTFPNGNVGIGTTNPSDSLDVRGGIYFGLNSFGHLTQDNSEPLIESIGAKNIQFRTNGTNKFILESGGTLRPAADNTYNLGSTSFRWANIYSADLQLSNEGSSNDVDGTWGQYTIQEGENDLFLLNRRNGKTYKFVLQEVN